MTPKTGTIRTLRIPAGSERVLRDPKKGTLGLRLVSAMLSASSSRTGWFRQPNATSQPGSLASRTKDPFGVLFKDALGSQRNP